MLDRRAVYSHPALLCAILVATIVALYAPFLHNPLVFDDKPLGARHWAPNRELWQALFELRWIPAVTLDWTGRLFGTDIVAFRLGNVLLHAANATILFLFLRRLFRFASTPEALPSAHTWLAFVGALLFALHPVTVYATAYLIQRSILMAALFCLLMWLAYLEGVARDKPALLLCSALFYYLAVFSKELSIMAPAVALCLTLLSSEPRSRLFRRVAPTWSLYAVIALVGVVKSMHRIAVPYEPLAKTMLAHIDSPWALVLSAMNQSFLFFKYGLTWIVPYPGWMSVDMRVAFPDSLVSLPQVLGPVAFVFVVVLGGVLMRRRANGAVRLLGLGLLAPALLFATEFSTVRIQEPFVLYRSYLWFGLVFAALPALAWYTGVNKLLFGAALVALGFLPASWNRLQTFSDPALLWGDAAALLRSAPYPPGADRIFYNRGNAFLMQRRTEAAAADYAKAIQLNPENQGAYNNLGYVHYQAGRYATAVEYYQRAVELDPQARRPHFGLGLSYRAAGQEALARAHLTQSCRMGYRPACAESQKDGPQGESSGR